MKRPNMLSATFVKTVKTPGRYGDGRGGLGLSLLVRTAAGGHITKCWTQSVWIDQGPHQHRPRMLSGRDSRPARPRALENARGIAEGRDPRCVAEQQRAGHPPGRAAASLRWARRSRRCGARARTGARCSRRAFPADASTTRCWMPPARRTSPARRATTTPRRCATWGASPAGCAGVSDSRRSSSRGASTCRTRPSATGNGASGSRRGRQGVAQDPRRGAGDGAACARVTWEGQCATPDRARKASRTHSALR